jgi:hypothetical protein
MNRENVVEGLTIIYNSIAEIKQDINKKDKLIIECSIYIDNTLLNEFN